MERYKYKALNENGRVIRGVIAANNEVDLYNQLQAASMELVDCQPLSAKKGGSLRGVGKKITLRDLIQFFIHMDQMQGAGVPLLDALSDVRDTSDNSSMRDVMSEIHRAVSEGNSLSESMAAHPKVFGSIYVSLIKAGEETGDLSRIYRQIIKYLKWLDDMRSKVSKATRYPIIVTFVVLLTVVAMMGYVVPQITGFLVNMDQDLGLITIALIATSDFFKTYWYLVLGLPVVSYAIVMFLKANSEGFAYHFDSLMLKMPVFGDLIRKIAISRYAQTFSALFASGIDVISSLESSRKTVENRAMLEALEAVEKHVQSGTSLSDSLNASGEFPSMVVRMVRIGEESGNLSVVLDQVAEFYSRDVDEAVQALIALIEPILTGVLGVMILWIAVAVFGPIYGMLETLDF